MRITVERLLSEVTVGDTIIVDTNYYGRKAVTVTGITKTLIKAGNYRFRRDSGYAKSKSWDKYSIWVVNRYNRVSSNGYKEPRLANIKDLELYNHEQDVRKKKNKLANIILKECRNLNHLELDELNTIAKILGIKQE